MMHHPALKSTRKSKGRGGGRGRRKKFVTAERRAASSRYIAFLVLSRRVRKRGRNFPRHTSHIRLPQRANLLRGRRGGLHLRLRRRRPHLESARTANQRAFDRLLLNPPGRRDHRHRHRPARRTESTRKVRGRAP